MPKRVFRSLALEGREGGRGEVGWLDHQSAAAAPSLAGAAPRGLGGTALAPQLQPLLCFLVCETNAPHLLFLLPGNRARQRITPGGLFSPARFPGADTWNIKHDELFPLEQVTEQLPSAQLDPPAPRSSPASFPHPTLSAAALRCSQTAGKTQRFLPARQSRSISLLPGCCSPALLFGVP